MISTEGTFASQQYLHAIKEANPGVGVLPKAAPHLVDVVEAGEADSPVAEAALRDVLEEVHGWGADTLVLGCTHYPLLRPALARVAPGLTVVDSAETTAARVRRILAVNRLESAVATAPPPRLLVTGHPERFIDAAALLFGEAPPAPEVLDLWSTTRLGGRIAS